ncbi:recombinase RecA [Candidatus Roizmanbacteria bacterium RIFCSPHIGHO2_01_FULL_38_41]|uniref:Protein RecA n=1 Tax=Candidatus Zambryskibacteria bacterium RIFCSPLOWO2_12_FULL_39_16 TaxID=1802775 RepID=A0A1G2US69_9BACT|nr:MAG: recombinase RecA [Candidatus Roizmanbacteria bacterium RIFCSPHIGHO2_01_FULL_38_41]OHA94555.1 MAG: recombinase RecA [Candidatus Zambryskibacteria bacterium RIFCSPHIGHO2_02_FULL_38_22]OHA97457.1 MAG: recombinase RecA [Candidatus Zambryskibacteria bacterium RIFCSPHIGHO2_12_FULL_38_34]OHB09011.1 MAG: recombinase RecA [Candidatus Zambryskibacteria bacterium RIFCSPLOWO2_02_FULL_38_13]OHB12254.1 MAG: recombinase RecA [Candidatus Zambryskibacteria bacterium RIFCSPLOWO2_12_FULL_39_16]
MKKGKTALPTGRQAKNETVEKKDYSGVEDAVREIKTKFGDDSIMMLGDKPHVDVNSIPTGSIGLDAALGVGGVPRGRIIEIFGPESSGKTTLALHIIAEAQKLDGICAFIDAEHAMDPEYSQKLGVKIDQLLISQPDNGEQALDIVESLVRSGKIDVIVVDSVAALTPKDEIEGDMGAYHVGKQARLMSQALRKLTAIVAKSKTVVIFINQIRMQIGVMFGNPETTPGGKALKFYTSVRLDIRRIAQIKKGDEIMGGRIRVKVVKNKVAAPFKQTEFDLMYNEGISKEGEIIALGEKMGIIHKSGNSYGYLPAGANAKDEVKLGRGYDATRQFLKDKTNKKIAEEILKLIRKKLIENGGSIVPVKNESEETDSEK